jgi:predicted transcriptional regulator
VNYEKDQSAESEISYVSEPAVAYAVRGKTAREPWETDAADGEDWDDYDCPDADDWLEEALKDPRFLAMLDRDLAQNKADYEAGLYYTSEEIEEHIKQWERDALNAL